MSSWYDTTNKGSIQNITYDPSEVRSRNSVSEGNEIKNTDEKYKLQQKQNLDNAFTSVMEKRKVVDPVTGATTYEMYADPVKFSEAVFNISKKSGTPFSMDDVGSYLKYKVGRQQNAIQEKNGDTQLKGMGVTPEGTMTKAPSSDTPTIGQRKVINGITGVWDGFTWRKQ